MSGTPGYGVGNVGIVSVPDGRRNYDASSSLLNSVKCTVVIDG